MRQRSIPFILGLLLALILPPRLHAQTATNPPGDPNGKAANAQPVGQAPDEMTKKIAELVHAGKYSEAQQLTAGLLVAYPEDQRLIKAKAVIENLLSPGGSANAAPSSQPINTVAPAQTALTTSAESLTGMERVDYNALVELARQAQQTTDVPQQNKLLQQFMDQSRVFLQKHPDQMLIWQLRAASAISLNEPIAGYEAGEKLLATGAADSNDSKMQRLLAQLKNQGWLDKAWAEKSKKQLELTNKYGWMLGTWSEAFTSTWRKDSGINRGLWGGEKYDSGSTKYEHNEEFSLSKSSAVIEVYEVNAGVKSAEPRYKGTLLDSGQMHWEGVDALNERHLGGHAGREQWEQATSCEIDEHKGTMTLVFLSWNDQRDKNASQPEIHLFTRSNHITN